MAGLLNRGSPEAPSLYPLESDREYLSTPKRGFDPLVTIKHLLACCLLAPSTPIPVSTSELNKKVRRWFVDSLCTILTF